MKIKFNPPAVPQKGLGSANCDSLRPLSNHAGGQRSVVNQGAKVWRPSVKVTQFWRPFFVRLEKIILIKMRGNRMKEKLLEMIQVIVWLHTGEFIFVWFY